VLARLFIAYDLAFSLISAFLEFWLMQLWMNSEQLFSI